MLGEQLPVDADPSLTVYRLYTNAGFAVQARDILKTALDRSKALGESHPVRIQIYRAMAESWQSDGQWLSKNSEVFSSDQ